MKNDDIFPASIYIYDANGRYSEPIRVTDMAGLEQEMKTSVKKAIKEKREVRVTDPGDMMLFHSYKGHIKFDGKTRHVCSDCVQQYGD